MTRVSSPPEGFADSTANIVGRIVFEKTDGRLGLIAFHDDTRTQLDRVQERPGGPFVAMRGPISRHISARCHRFGDLRQMEASFPVWIDAKPGEIAEKIIENLRTESPWAWPSS